MGLNLFSAISKKKKNYTVSRYLTNLFFGFQLRFIMSNKNSKRRRLLAKCQLVLHIHPSIQTQIPEKRFLEDLPLRIDGRSSRKGTLGS